MKKLFMAITLLVLLISLAYFSKDYFSRERNLPKGTGLIPWSEKLKNQYCKDSKTGTEISYQEANTIAQKNKCGIQGETSVTYSTKYICNEDTGTWWVDLKLTPQKAGCNPACVVNIVTKTAEINWRCTGAISR